MHLQSLAASARIAAEVVVVIGESPAEAIQQTSANAAIVILGFEPPAEGDEATFFDRMDTLAGKLPRVLFVDSAGGMELES